MATIQATTAAAKHYTMRVVSQPLKELVGQGQNAKHVKDCTELYLGNKGIEQLAGFERLVNLEVLWLNDNKLSAINNLNNNIRIKQLYGHNNMICTLKGSLLHFKFLSHLDLSGNQLRDLGKLLNTLHKLHFIQELNLQGNPCCEEPDYRLLLIHAMPSLQVLDHHQVTTAERMRAAAEIGGDVSINTVAFGRRVHQELGPAAAATDCQGRSVLEQELAKMAETIRDKQHQAAAEAEAALYATNPDAGYYAQRSSLPPPPGVLEAQQAWAAAGAATAGGTLCSCTMASSQSQATAAVPVVTTGQDAALPWQGAANGAAQQAAARVDQLQLTGSSGVMRSSMMSGFAAGCLTPSSTSAGISVLPNNYTAKDVLVLHYYRQRSDAGSAGIASSSSSSRYLQGTFGHHLTDRRWEVEPTALKL